MIYLIITTLFLLFFLQGIKKDHAFLIVLAHVIRGLITILNLEYSFFESKEAGDYSMLLYEYWQSQGFKLPTIFFSLITNSFSIQALLCIPGFKLFGVNLFVVCLTNNAIVSFALAISLKVLRKTGNVNLMLVTSLALFPSVINFSLYGLRDPIIYALILILYSVSISSIRGRIMLMLMCIVPLLLLRGELFVIYFFPFLIDILLRINFIDKRTFHFKTKKLIVLTIIILTLFPLIVEVGSFFAFKSSLSLEEILFQKLDRRYNIAIENGGNAGSHIYSSAVSSNSSFLTKWIIQIAALIINPFPWTIKSISHLLAFFESIILMKLLFVASRIFWSQNKRRFLVISYLLGITMLGVMIINFGNGFRMRFVLLPILLIAVFFRYKFEYVEKG